MRGWFASPIRSAAAFSITRKRDGRSLNRAYLLLEKSSHSRKLAERSRARAVMFKKIAVTVSAVAFLMLAVALAPGVPTVLARVGTPAAIDDAKLNEPLAQQSCEAFENWFLDLSCRQPHARKTARTKKNFAHNWNRATALEARSDGRVRSDERPRRRE
jgi:hypothetical protein